MSYFKYFIENFIQGLNILLFVFIADVFYERKV